MFLAQHYPHMTMTIIRMISSSCVTSTVWQCSLNFSPMSAIMNEVCTSLARYMKRHAISTCSSRRIMCVMDMMASSKGLLFYLKYLMRLGHPFTLRRLNFLHHFGSSNEV